MEHILEIQPYILDSETIKFQVLNFEYYHSITIHQIISTFEMSDSFVTQPPPTSTYLLSFPAPHVLLVTINRESARNSIPFAGHAEGDALFTWFDYEPSLRVAVITGAGSKAFCAGADLMERNTRKSSVDSKGAKPQQGVMPASGFAGLSRRKGKKPVVMAVNGPALGGGFEICLNS
jgi:enoyl-CoA hydratase/carnithine racemase